MKWISVKDELPEIIENYPGSETGVSYPVLVLFDKKDWIGSRIYVSRCFRGGRGDTTSIHWDADYPTVTHWAELPTCST